MPAASNRLQNVVAVRVGHIPVEEDHVQRVVERRERFPAAVGDPNVVLVFEPAGKQIGNRLFVVDDEYSVVTHS